MNSSESVRTMSYYNKCSPIPEKTTKRRGKLAKSDAHNLRERLKKHEASV